MYIDVNIMCVCVCVCVCTRALSCVFHGPYFRIQDWCLPSYTASLTKTLILPHPRPIRFSVVLSLYKNTRRDTLNVFPIRLPLPHSVIPSLHLPRHKGILCCASLYKAGRVEATAKWVSGGRWEDLASSLRVMAVMTACVIAAVSNECLTSQGALLDTVELS
jgi:hypothetical protein